MEWQVEECIEAFEHDRSEEGAAKLIVCLMNNKENIYWDEGKKRLALAAEIHDESWSSIMESITKALGVSSRDEYIKVKYKYNLTQF